MKKGFTVLIIIFIIELFFTENIFSQIVIEEIKLQTIYPGLIITLENDTISGYIMLTNLMKNQNKVEFYNSPDDPEPAMKYKPKELKAYMVGPRFYESVKFQPKEKAEAYYFFHRVADGPIKVFKWYYPPPNQSRLRFQVKKDKSTKFGFVSPEEDLVSQSIAIKLGGKPINLESKRFVTNFKKHMGAMVEEDDELVGKISKKETGHTFDYIENIIEEFNYWYTKLYK